jgi:hypothetical protein
MVTAVVARRLIEAGANRADFERRVPLVNTAAAAMRRADNYLGLGIVSGRADLVLAFRDLNRTE